MLRIGIAFLVGDCIVQCLSQLPDSSWILWLGIAVLCTWLMRARVLLAMTLGICWAWGCAAVQLRHDLPLDLEGRDLTVSGWIVSLPQLAMSGTQFDFEIDSQSAQRVFPADAAPRTVRLTWYDNAPPLTPGERWTLTVRLQRRHGFANPGGYDYEGQLFRAGIGATGYVRASASNARREGQRLRDAVLRTRGWLAQRIAAAIPDSPMIGVLQGLAVGETTAISAQQWQVFGATGTTHLLAISGLHISMIAALFAWLGSWLTRARWCQARRLTALHGQTLGGLASAIGYSLLAGLSTPTERTLAMLCIYFVARAWRRQVSVSHSLGLALLGVLLVDPFAALSVGTWLSFGAVATLVLATAGTLAPAGVLQTFGRAQSVVTIGMLPVLVVAFGSTSLIAPFANVLAVPLFTLVLVPLTLMGTFCAAVCQPLGATVLSMAAQILQWCWPLFDWLAHLDGAVWHFAQPGLLQMMTLVLGVGLLILPGVWVTRLAGAALCVPAFLSPPSGLGHAEFSFAMLDVGQGLAVVVRTAHHTLLYDAGPAFRSGHDTGELVVLPYLHAIGVHHLDGMMISHADQDHIGGAARVIAGMRTDRAWVGPSIRRFSMPANVCEARQSWEWDGVRFEVLAPTPEVAKRDNDSSCVLRIVGSGGQALLTGDIEKTTEAMLVNAGADLSATIVSAPHHGSKSSSTAPFIARVGARYALMSVGYRNRWGFPQAAVLERWQEAGATTFDTAQNGAIEIIVRNDGLARPHLYRSEHRRYWRVRQPASIHSK